MKIKIFQEYNSIIEELELMEYNVNPNFAEKEVNTLQNLSREVSALRQLGLKKIVLEL